MMKTKVAFLATSALVGSLLLATNAMAQSTGTSAAEEVVITATRGPATVDGAMVAETEPKARATITQEFISSQVPGQTVLDTINLLPGVNFTNNDAYGSAGGDLTLRGFDSQRVALIQDGVPLNDSGNYAVYPNQQLDSELIERVAVNLGTTDVDSPTAAAAGGTINYITRKPSKDAGLRLETSFGDENLRRLLGVIETGEIGPFGTTAWFSAHYTTNDIYSGPGKIEKKQYNGRIYQPLNDGDFVSVIFNWNENRNNFIRRSTVAQFNAHTNPVYDATCTRPGGVNGTVQNEATSGTGFTATCANYVGNNINPSNTGNIRGQGKFHLQDNLVLTVDPSFQYVLANGGGRTVFAENDSQLGPGGLDLNGDGDRIDRIMVYWPNTTNTRRWGVTSSLIWSFAENQNVRVAYTWDEAHHRQTGQATQFDRLGDPLDVFGGKDGYGEPIRLADGSILKRRDRLSVATLNQIAFEYRGRFMEDKLLVNAGLRAPFFERNLQNFCYQRDTFNAYCPPASVVPVAVVGTNDGNGQTLVTFPTANDAPYSSTANQVSGDTTRFGRPRSFTKKYDKVLPNVGVSYKFGDNNTVYLNYSETLSAPRTDDLYDRDLTKPEPEIAKSVDLGYRYQNSGLLVAGSIWHNSFSNRIERVFDEPSGIAFSQNIGKVTLWGVDGQAAWKPTETLTLYGSLSYVDSEIKDNAPSGVGTFYQTKGKSLYEVPKWQGGARVSWEATDYLTAAIQAKAISSRWTNLENTEKVKGYTLVDADVRLKLSNISAFHDMTGLDRTYLQFNVKNLFDTYWAGDVVTNLSGTGQVQVGYPRTFVATLHVEF